MSRILVLGSNGMLGHAMSYVLTNVGHSVISMSRNEFDATGPISNLNLKELNVEYVINCIGIIKQREKDYTPSVMAKVNSVFPIELARHCQVHHTRMIHVSTDCVFDGTLPDERCYLESSPITATDLYGITKAAGEAADAMVLRTSIIGDEKDVNSFSLFEWLRSKSGQEISGYIDHRWSGLTTYQLASCVDDIIRKDYYANGIFQLHAPEPITKYNLASMISDIFDFDIKVLATSAGHMNRSLGNETPLCDYLNIPGIEQQLLDMKNIIS